MPSITMIKVIGIAIVLGLIGMLVLDRAALKTDIADQKVTITQLQDANADFAATAARQNAAIAAEAKLRADMEAKYQDELKANALRDVESKKEQLAILNQKVTGDHCVYAHQLLTSFMKGRHP